MSSPLQARIAVEATNPSHYGASPCDGSVTITAKGDVPELSAGPFTIEIIGPDFHDTKENVEGSWTIENLCSGDYTILVTNAYGCITTLDANVPCRLELKSRTRYTCDETGTAIIGVRPINGSQGEDILYTWTDPFGNIISDQSHVTVSAPGDYTVEMTLIPTTSGCTATEVFSHQPTDEMPYVKKVKVFADDTKIYEAEWILTGEDCLLYTGGLLPIGEELLNNLAESSLSMEVETSEALNNLSVYLEGGEGGAQEGMPMGDGTMWNFGFQPGVLSNLASNPNLKIQLIFWGKDLQGNGIMPLNELSANQTTCVDIPRKWGTCDWTIKPQTGKDGTHILELSCISARVEVHQEEGSISIDIMGGTSPYKVLLIKNGQVASSITTEDNQVTFDQLEPGFYTIEVISKEECMFSKTVQLCKPLVVAATIKPPCAHGLDGSICIDLDIEGALFQWIGGPNTPCWENLGAGEYSVKIYNPICEQSIVETFVLQESEDFLEPPVATEIIPTCEGQSNGKICISPVGGTPPYTYRWENGSSVCGFNLSSGTHCVTVTDACGASIRECFEVPTSDISITNVSVEDACGEAASGSIQLELSGEQTLEYIRWKRDEGGFWITTTPVLSDIPTGTYYILIQDICNNTEELTVEVGSFQGEPFDIHLQSIEHLCSETANTGAINIEVVDATGENSTAYSYEWSNGAMTQNVSGLETGEYSVTVTNEEGCERVGSFNVKVEETIVLSTIKPVCNDGENLNNGAIFLEVEGYAPFTFEWNTGATTQNLEYLPVGTYMVTITDDTGCQIIRAFEVGYTILAISLDNLQNSTIPTIEGENDGNGAIEISVSGDNPPFEFEWSHGTTSEDIYDLPAGTYTVTVTDKDKCMATRTFEIESCQPLNAFINPFEMETCHNEFFPGSMSVIVEGGEPPYSYFWEGPGNFTGNGTATIDNISEEGIFQVTVIDACGTSEVVIQEIRCNCELLVATYQSSNRRCTEFYIGINFLIGTGSNFYHINWYNMNGLMETALISAPPSIFHIFPEDFTMEYGSYYLEDLPAGNYAIEVMDEFGCSYTQSFEFNSTSSTYTMLNTQGGLSYYNPDLAGINEDHIYGHCITSKGCSPETGTPGTLYWLNYAPIDTLNPCRAGGTLSCPNDGLAILVPPNDLATTLNYGEKCACYFPPGTIPEVAQPVYVSFPCSGEEIPDDPLPNTGNGAEPHIEDCEDIFIGDPEDTPCEYPVICIETMEILYYAPGATVTCYQQIEEGVYQLFEQCNADPCQITSDGEVVTEAELGLFPGMLPCFDCFGNGDNPINRMKANLGKIQGNNQINNKATWKPLNGIYNSKIYPNPFSNTFNIQVNIPESTKLQISIFDLLGNQVWLETKQADKGNHNYELSLAENLPDGIYHLRLKDEKGHQKIHKIIKINK